MPAAEPAAAESLRRRTTQVRSRRPNGRSRGFSVHRVLATGRAGDVFLCHPFIVHTATWPHRGAGPRMIAQPSVYVPDGFAVDGTVDVTKMKIIKAMFPDTAGKYAGPEQWRENAPQQYWATREHRKCDTVQKANQGRPNHVNNDGEDQSRAVECEQLLIVHGVNLC